MKKIISLILALLVPTLLQAHTANFTEYFKDKSGCFILYDLTHDRLLAKYNSKRCEERIAADSTFKIPLSLMAFDQHLITQTTIFKWDGKPRELPIWNHNQTPQTWLKNSVVWVSQQLTPKIGLPKIKKYLHDFNYGNQDFSGNPGKHDGLTQAWLSSSLKISANEQLIFLRLLATEKLPVSKAAMDYTIANLFVEQTKNGWQLYGKTGSGFAKNRLPEGWFIGMTQKNNQRYLFVVNFTAKTLEKDAQAGGITAKTIAKSLLAEHGVY